MTTFRETAKWEPHHDQIDCLYDVSGRRYRRRRNIGVGTFYEEILGLPPMNRSCISAQNGSRQTGAHVNAGLQHGSSWIRKATR